MSDTQQPVPNQAQRQPQSTQDQLPTLLARFDQLKPLIAKSDPGVATSIDSLKQSARSETLLQQPGTRHQAAYVLQDLEKSAVGRIDLPMPLRNEMDRLASSAAGLANERMQAVMRATATILDRGLIADIRTAGREIGQRVDQSTPDVQSRIEVLENRIRLSPRPTEGDAAAAARPPATQSDADPERVNETRKPAAIYQSAPTTTVTAAQQRPAITINRTPLDAIFSRMRADETPARPAPWDPAPTSFQDRMTGFERQTKEGAREIVLERVEHSGRAALDALKAFSDGESVAVMNRIHEAAKSEPGGMAAVLGEMRQGGKFADLRGQFNNALFEDQGVARAYDKAAAAVAQYGQERAGVETAIAGRPDATNLAAKFNQLDAEIGDLAAGTPSRRDGKTMMDDLAQQVADLLQRAMEGARAVFSHMTGDSGARSSSPSSPSPG